MLIFDPRTGQSVAVDLTAKLSLATEAAGLRDTCKVPHKHKNILANSVRSALQLKYKNARQNWNTSNDERKKNNITLHLHGDGLRYARPRAWSYSI